MSGNHECRSAGGGKASAGTQPDDIQLLLAKIVEKYRNGAWEECLRLCAAAKSRKIPCRNLDFMRAAVFFSTGDAASCRESLKEELRYFPDNTEAQNLLAQIAGQSRAPVPSAAPEAFKKLYRQIAPYTMVSPARLLCLYTHAERVCASPAAGNFVECGVAGGGSSVLLASVIKRNSTRAGAPVLYSCDSFEGMPPASAHDVHAGIRAEDTGWGCGTCAAPESSVLNLAKKLFCSDVLRTVKGYFEKTLPVVKAEIGPIVFLHMDGDWYSSTKAVLENLYDQLVPGAYVQIDDYFHWEGCKKATDEFFAARNLPVVVRQIDAAGGFFIVPGESEEFGEGD